VLLAEERQARRVLRREAKWNEEQRDGQRDDYEEEYMEQQQQQAQLQAAQLEQQQRTLPQDKRSSATTATTVDSVDSAESMDHLNPALASSPLRKGGERLPSRGHGGRSRGGSGSRRQGGQGRRQGSSRGLQQESGLNGSLRPVLAWHEKARLLMQRWEREMAVSAWPTDASTGRMSPTRRSTARGRR